MLTQELSQSVERTIITLGVIAFTGAMLFHFGLTTESLSLTLPIITPVMAYWYTGQASSNEARNRKSERKDNP